MEKRPPLEFDAGGHLYFIGGRQVIGVTKLCRRLIAAGKGKPGELYTPMDQAALERGTYVHKWLERRALDSYLELPELHRGYCQAGEKWLRDSEATTLMVEARVTDGKHYAGTVDWLGLAKPSAHLDPRPCLVDYKTGSAGHAELQLALYGLALYSTGAAYEDLTGWVEVQPAYGLTRVVVELHADGTYKHKVFSNPAELMRARRLLSTVNLSPYVKS